MEPGTLKAILTIVGVVLELGGIALVVIDVAATRRNARAVLDAGPPPQGPTRTVSAIRTMAYEVEGREPDIEERVEILEDKVERLFADVSRREDELRQMLREEIARTGIEAMKLADERDRALRAFISAQLTGNVRRGAIGAFLLALGVTTAASANLVS